MKRKIRHEEEIVEESYDFKLEIIKDLLYQIDYQTAYRQKVVNVEERDMINALKKLPTSVLLAWYFAYLYIRRELMHAGYELHGLKVLDVPLDTIHELIEEDPTFDLKEYIF